GGAQRALCYLATAMDRNRFQLQVAIWGSQEDLCKELEVLGVDVVRLRGVGRSLVRLALALGSHVRRTRPDVIHTHLFDAEWAGLVRSLGAALPRAGRLGHKQGDADSARREAARASGLSGGVPASRRRRRRAGGPRAAGARARHYRSGGICRHGPVST